MLIEENDDEISFFDGIVWYYLKFFLLGICLTILVVGCFWLGGYFSCSNGGGEMIGFSCSDVEVLGVCEYDGKNYVSDDVWFSNETVFINNG